MTNRVSIIIPFHNSGKYLADTIGSAIGQTWPDKEVILVDDGSADDSRKIAESFCGPGVMLCLQDNRGASAARNAGLRTANGRYIQFLDADDILSPDKIARQMALLLRNPDSVAVCSTVHFSNSSDLLQRGPSAYEESFLVDADPQSFLLNLWGGINNQGSMVQPNAWLTPKKIIEKAGGWNETLTLDDDGEFFCRVIMASAGVVVAPETYNYYRKNPGKTLSSRRKKEDLISLYHSIKLKMQHVAVYHNDNLNKALGRSLASLLMITYPQHRQLSKQLLAEINEAGGLTYLPELGGPVIEWVKRNFGWQTARQLQYRYAQISGKGKL